MFFWVQVFQGLSPGFRGRPKVDCRFKRLTFTSWYLCLQFFFFKHQCKKNICTKVFLIHNNLVTQKISYSEIIYQSRKRCSLFCIRKRFCVNFLKYSIDFFIKTILIFLWQKCFVYNYHCKKSSETYFSICCVTYIYFLFYIELF